MPGQLELLSPAERAELEASMRRHPSAKKPVIPPPRADVCPTCGQCFSGRVT